MTVGRPFLPGQGRVEPAFPDEHDAAQLGAERRPHVHGAQRLLLHLAILQRQGEQWCPTINNPEVCMHALTILTGTLLLRFGFDCGIMSDSCCRDNVACFSPRSSRS